MYISCASGNDSWSCDESMPCKTIWRAVTLASRGDSIYLDGTNTENDPYTCQPGTAALPGILIKNSLALIGIGPRAQIRCSEGTSLIFDGSDNAQQMEVTLTNLLVRESFVCFRDSSAKISACELQGSHKGLQFVTRDRLVSSIQITNSTFDRNSECVSVVVNGTNMISQTIQVTVEIKHSSFEGNILPYNGNCVSFTEYPFQNQSVNSAVTLENVTFSRNKFVTKGLVFVESTNGNHTIHLQGVTFINNSLLGSRDALTGYSLSEVIVRSTLANIFINASSFTGQNARLLNASTSIISLQIYNSSFRGHNVQGNGGVVSIRGSSLCQVEVSDSSFANTTASQGGVFNVECAKVMCSFQGNIFTGNTAIHGEGGSAYIDAFGSGSSNAKYATYGKDAIDPKTESEHHLQLSVSKCVFTDAYSFLHGGALQINALKALVQLCHSTFTNCTSLGHGGALNVVSLSGKSNSPSLSGSNTSDIDLNLVVKNSQFKSCSSGHYGGSLSIFCVTDVVLNITNSTFISNYAAHSGGALSLFPPPISSGDRGGILSQITIENSTFSNNNAKHDGGAMCIVLDVYKSIFILQNVIMESNGATSGGALSIPGIFGVKILQSRLLRNRAGAMGGALCVQEINLLEIEDSLFDGNIAWGMMQVSELGGALYISGITGKFSRDISIINTTFQNCSTGQLGGAIYLYYEEGNITFTVKKSRFLDNLSFQSSGGTVLLSLPPDIKKDPGCAPNSDNHVNEKYPSWVYKSYVVFEDTTFHRNGAGFGGAVHLTNGKTSFRNCNFVDNFATSQSAHIYTMEGSASLTIQDSLFRQTLSELRLLTMNYSKTSFIHTESSGAVKIYNTTMDARPYGSGNPLMAVANGRLIDFGTGNLTKFYCPVGSQIEILNVTDKVITMLDNKPCKIEVVTFKFSCSACSGNSYSLQRGRSLGSQLVSGFQCLPCPFGANCSQNILAKRNFWGFQKQSNPPKLRFTMCPVGYCDPPNIINFPKFNGCQNNRSGDLCGHCNEGYTETLYSTNCRPSQQCKDYWFWPVALIYVSFMALYFTLKPPFVPWIKHHILWFKVNERADQENNFDKGYLKILFFFYQAANLFLISNSSQSLVKANLIEPVVGLFNFRFLSSGLSCPFPGLTVVSKQFFSASHVFCTMLVICIFYVLHWGIQRLRGQGVPSVGPYVGGILQTLLLGYTTLASVSFTLLRCVPTGPDRRLFYDGNVVCFQWWQYLLIAFVCIFVVPFVFVLLWGSYKLYGATLSVGQFLLACAFPLPSFIYWSFLYLFGKKSNPIVGDPSPHRGARNYVEIVLYASFKRPDDGNILSLSWESVMIGRRLILIMLKAFVSDPLLRLLIMTLFGVLFLLHHALTQPFRDAFANTVETISLLFIVVLGLLNVFFASFLSLAVPLDDHFSTWWNVCQGIEVVILCLVPGALGLLILTVVLSQLCRITVVVCRFLSNLFWICFRFCYTKQDDETRPLLTPVS